MLDLKWVEQALRQLLAKGYVGDAQGQLKSVLTGHAHPVAGGWVVSQPLLQTRTGLSNDAELVMALLAQVPTMRAPWLRIAAARCQEAGLMADEQSLLDEVSQLGAAAPWVEASLPEASLMATPTATLERSLLGTSAEQALAMPALRRVLATSHGLDAKASVPLPSLPSVDPAGERPAQNWVAGRLLALPGTQADARYLLQGAGELMPQTEALLAQGAIPGVEKSFPREYLAQPAPVLAMSPGTQNLHWLMCTPWAFFLAMVVYAQDAWAAECRGGLLLELPEGQSAHAPSEIAVLVQSADGGELACGNLADLLLRSLAHLGMACFPGRPSSRALNALLSPLMGQMLSRKVWRYVEAASGARGQYQIHPEFADEAYRTLGSRVIRRGAGAVWQSVRIQAEEMRAQALALAGVSVSTEKWSDLR
ncbi:hypothetical protein [Paraburkholderia sediminicola]|uniref:hypothetical protein n=1 Tax=Paraburkholderia sediminicola TaxID=458836 RepID=UPI0038BB5921